MGSLAFIPHNAHRVDVDGRAMLMHVPTTSLFEMDEVSRSVLDLFRRVGVADADLLKAATGGQATGTFGVLNAGGTVNQVYETGYRGNKRYVRVALANFGTTSVGTNMDVVAVLGRPRMAPINS